MVIIGDIKVFCNFVSIFKNLNTLIEKHIGLEDTLDPVTFYGTTILIADD